MTQKKKTLTLSCGLRGKNSSFRGFRVFDFLVTLFFFYFLVTLFRVGFFLSVAYLAAANLARLGNSVHCYVSGPSIQSSSSPSAGLQVVTQSSHLSKDCSPNWYRTHTVPKIGLQSSQITGACHYTWHLKYPKSKTRKSRRVFFNLNFCQYMKLKI